MADPRANRARSRAHMDPAPDDHAEMIGVSARSARPARQSAHRRAPSGGRSGRSPRKRDVYGVQQMIENTNYLNALHDSQPVVGIVTSMPKFTDPKVQRIEERLRQKGALNFDRIFYEPTGYYLFIVFLEEHADFRADKALFIKDAEAYSQMRFAPARLKVARFIFHRYFAQTPLPVEEDADEQMMGKKKKKKKKNKLEVPLPPRPSVFEAIKQRNKTKRLSAREVRARAASRSRATTPRGRKSKDLKSINERQPGRAEYKEHKSNGGGSTPRERYSPRYSLSLTDQDGSGEVFEVGVENDIQLYGAAVQDVALKLTRGEAPKDLFTAVAREARAILVRDAFPQFRGSVHYQNYIRTKTIEEQKVGIEDFEILRVLGRGGFGTVYACRKEDSGKLYAVKAITKKLIKYKKAVAMTMLERHTLSLVHSRFVCGLSYAFQDADHLYLAMELMAGGDLKFHLTRSKSQSRPASPRKTPGVVDPSSERGGVSAPSSTRSRGASGRDTSTSHGRGFSEDRARFHAAEILLGLEAMHAKNIIFRDLKLENVLLDDEGHCRISDLGLVALYGKKKISHYAGTPGYIAPEVAKKEPYTPAVDLFSLGVTIYRMISGKKPFKGHSRKDFDRAVCQDEPVFDTEVFTPEAIDLIQGLLEKNPVNRLGCGKGRQGIQAIKDHPWFQYIDWGLLEVGYLDPPFVPNMHELNANTVSDMHNDDDAKNWDKMVLDDKFRKQIHGFDYVSKHAVRKEIVAACKKQREDELEKVVRKAEQKANTSCCIVS